MQKFTLLFILVINGILGITLVWSQLAFVQASTNESGTIQCITTPCDYPTPQPLPMPPDSDSNNDTVTAPKNGIESPTEVQNSSNQFEPCLSPCPPGTEMCIQMCKVPGQQGTTNEEIESQSGSQQEDILSSVPDKSLSGMTTSEQPTIEDEAETTNSESNDSSESS